MKLLAALIMTISLAFGLIASLTGYVPNLDRIDPEQELTLNAPAGVDPDAPGRPRFVPAQEEDPIVLTAEVIEQLKEDGETRVRVKEFDFGRWEYWWLFTIACVGLLVGALMMRIASRRALEETARQEQAEHVSPPDLLHAAFERLQELRTQINREPDQHASMKRMIDALDSIHAEQLEPFVEAKQVLVGHYGMTGYAQLMDKFAAAERQVNRAWSASADEVYEEAVECLDEAIARMKLAIDQLEELTPRESGEIDQPLTPEPSPENARPAEGAPPRGYDHDRPLS